MIILGVSAFSPMASAAVLADGDLVAASAEERFSRIRADAAFPEHAIRFCLDRARTLTGRIGVDRVAVADRTDAHWARPPRATIAELRGAVAGWTDKQGLRRRIRQVTDVDADQILFVDALRAHAANAFLTSPFPEANILVAQAMAGGPVTATGAGSGASVDLDAFAAQSVDADVLVRIAADAAGPAGLARFCLSGSCLDDARAVGHLIASPAVHELFLPPAVHADGAALGAALHLWHLAAGQPRAFEMRHAYWGAQITRDDAVAAAGATGLTCVEADEDELINRVVELIDAGHLVGWAQEAAEWGDRPLGHRSVLTNLGAASSLEARLLRAGVAPGVVSASLSVALPIERAGSMLDIDRPIDGHPSRFAGASVRLRADALADWPGHPFAGQMVPIQTVLRAENPRFHALIERLAARSGVPALVQAPLAGPGGPLANSPVDAVEAFTTLGLDALVLDRVLLLKDLG